ncbi:thiopeptide-type bacteriocin biosynthesis protein [Kitasatospora sp. NBC_01266]|uniref:thiopeptide-type bacteriocin biosynthesis protein n=1 Tax=Kitasatospora sp. NBC_01266 TaxID=2903572 RepID=UPI002E322BA1|nr:thiopeptide-type bacteriocin biosynthesis protein [Kitasatospora sp. NBC_01266]
MVEVERLLADCLRDARDIRPRTVPIDSAGPGYEAARRTFLTAGLSALRDDLPEAGWVQFNLAPGPTAWRRTYRVIAATARELIAADAVRSFFFMHKSPGLRVRFEAGGPDVELLRQELACRFRELDGQLSPPRCGRYEPETYLFGGPLSMRYVHELFTADSLAWLDHHDTAVAAPGRPAPVEPVADWRLSLYLLGRLLRGLGVVGWEYRGVWQVVQDETGRRLGVDPDDDARRAAAGILAAWQAGGPGLLAPLPPQRRAAVEAHGDAVRRAAERWRTGYFESGDALVGPRRAAAYHVIFHWNRGRLSLARQSLLTHALAGDGRF